MTDQDRHYLARIRAMDDPTLECLHKMLSELACPVCGKEHERAKLLSETMADLRLPLDVRLEAAKCLIRDEPPKPDKNLPLASRLRAVLNDESLPNTVRLAAAREVLDRCVGPRRPPIPRVYDKK